MNDNTPLDADDFAEWVWDIVERYDLGLRADSPLAGATVLLADAAFDLKELELKTFREQALTEETRGGIAACAVMLADVLKLAQLCPGEPSAGHVTETDDGTLTWAPAGASDDL
ncbi:hypothetical protein MKK75_11175 [Methylobacterium sp. J-030]|uniref:hypothetical protein n=1 Tax=Methylobacterium sp. J-030 TaxID=2836627 RepID=UPI001FB94A20|nr:hypothetical protein [Methylobacterium sp. J-030]MCJ2069351.1 hypothetical protein [Methylobacterium sp. J-030]